jgi:bile acid:Na+ symporter, BASS family
MDGRKSVLAAPSRFIHEHFLWFLIGSYVIAAVFPGLGLRLRGVSLGEITLFQEKTRITLPMLMLALLLCNAGLGVQLRRLRNLFISPLPLAGGLLANAFFPIGFVFVVSQTMRFWHNPDEVQNILVGLALVAAMPIAGSSTAWSQNADGDMALSLGLLLISTFLSPWTTPIALHAAGFMTTGDYAEDLHALATDCTGAFLAICVLLPSLLGIALHKVVGERRVASAGPLLKLVNSGNLLLLNYTNACVCLPQTVADPDWDFLAVVLGIVSALCVLAFVSGLAISRFLKADLAQQVSLVFALGMNNNGAGLVLASMTLAGHPRVLLPIIFYNLVQHLVAGGMDLLLFRRSVARTRSALC